ncbi:MAG: DUF2149 domain-containing protein [Halomonadaceae bacterium]|nr:MAG: DUF2149 domain-containing protein [Halomonadaceae bacterium]
MSIPHYRRSRFDDGDEDPMGPLANLADIMLVFAVGLMVALAASEQGRQSAPEQGQDVSTGREIPEMPAGTGEAGSGYESMGQVYRDPETGRMILIGPD